MQVPQALHIQALRVPQAHTRELRAQVPQAQGSHKLLQPEPVLHVFYSLDHMPAQKQVLWACRPV